VRVADLANRLVGDPLLERDEDFIHGTQAHGRNKSRVSLDGLDGSDVGSEGAEFMHGAPARGDSKLGGDRNKTDPKIKVLADRLALQVFSVPSLQAHLADYAVVPSGKPDGSVRIQLDFLKLPKEILSDLERLLSVDYFKNHRLVKYTKNGQARTGLEIEVTPKELPGEAYDYAF